MERLDEQFQQLFAERKLEEAAAVAEQALAIRKRTLSVEHVDVAISLEHLARVYRVKKDYEKAEALYEQALAIREAALGSGHAEVARTLQAMGWMKHTQGDVKGAVGLMERALAQQREALGPEHPDVASALEALGRLHWAIGNQARAEELFGQSLATLESGLGPEHPSVAEMLARIGKLYGLAGHWTRAIAFWQRALKIQEQVFGSQHEKVAAALEELGENYISVGELPSAAAHAQRALAILEVLLGPSHPAIARPLLLLANVYRMQGDYVSAEPLYERALKIQETAFGPEAPQTAASLMWLAEIHREKGDLVRAESLFERTLKLQPDMPAALMGQAAMCVARGDLVRAESLLVVVLADKEKAVGPVHPGVMEGLEQVARVKLLRADYQGAQSLLERAAAIGEKTGHWYVSYVLASLAKLHQAKGDFGRAQDLYERVLAIQEPILGSMHPHVADVLVDFANLHTLAGLPAKALPLLARACAIQEHNLNLVLATGSEKQKQAYMATVLGTMYTTVSFHRWSMSENVQAARLAAETVLQRKGRILDALSASMETLKSGLDPEGRRLFDELSTTRSRLARVVLGGRREYGPTDYRLQVEQLEEQVQSLEDAIGARSAEFQVASAPVSLARLQEAIPSGMVLIDIVAYRVVAPDSRWGELRYAACIVRSRADPVWVDIGGAIGVEARVRSLRQALANPATTDVLDVAGEAYRKIWKPIREFLGDAEWVLLSPDGILNLLPFGALVDEEKHFLLERYSFTYLNSGRDLLRPRIRVAATETAVIVADPDFEAGHESSGAPTMNPNLMRRRSRSLETTSFTRLAGTRAEAEGLRQILGQVRLLTGSQANEATLKEMHGPRIVHIATHGFFLHDQAIEPVETRGVVVTEMSSAPAMDRDVENPLLRSGLALAGANAPGSEGEDGILTALEASGLDLRGTKLAVLSACETGVGEVKNGEGVYGLRRAFALAGSETQVMSLWKVDDAATCDLMLDYYQRLLAGGGRSESLRAAQLRMLRTPDHRHPYYWASFICNGEWTDLDGRDVRAAVNEH